MQSFTLKPKSLSILQAQLHWVMRITTALVFIGHGAWGIITKEGWLPFFACQGIGETVAWKLMPLIGIFDIALAILVLWQPRRIALMIMFFWALWTAMLRPISGTPGLWEFIERAGNYAPPFIMLIMAGTFAMKYKDWFNAYEEPKLTEDRLGIIHFICRISIALLLIGHGGFGAFVQKPMLIDHFASIGIQADIALIKAIGLFEILLGIAVLIAPLIPMLWLVLIWKLFTEFLYVTEGGILNIFEFIERFGDYGLPIALIMIINYQKKK